MSEKILLLLLLCAASCLDVAAQVGINTVSPDASAEYDITSSDKGVLIPRLTDAQMATLGSGASSTEAGLMIYNTSQKKFYYYTGSAWQQVGGTCIELSDEDGDTKIQVEKSADEDKVRVTAAGIETLVIDDDSVSVEQGNLTIDTGTLVFGSAYSLPTTDGSSGFVLGVNNSNQVLWRNPGAALGLVVGIETTSFANVDQFFDLQAIHFVRVVSWSTMKVTKMAFLMNSVGAAGATPQLGIYDAARTTLLTSGTGTHVATTSTPVLVEVPVTPFTLVAGTQYWFAIVDTTGGGSSTMKVYSQVTASSYSSWTQSGSTLPNPAATTGDTDKAVWISAY